MSGFDESLLDSLDFMSSAKSSSNSDVLKPTSAASSSVDLLGDFLGPSSSSATGNANGNNGGNFVGTSTNAAAGGGGGGFGDDLFGFVCLHARIFACIHSGARAEV